MRTQPGDHANPARYLGEPGPVTTRIWPGACENPAQYLGEPSPAVDASGGPVLSSFAAPRARCHAGLLGALGNDCCRLGWLGARERTPALWHLLGSRRCCPRRTQVTSAHLPHSPRCPGPASPTPQVASQTPPNKGTCGPSHDTSDLRGCQSKAEEAMTRVSGQRQRMKPERGQLLISLCAHARAHAHTRTHKRTRTRARTHRPRGGALSSNGICKKWRPPQNPAGTRRAVSNPGCLAPDCNPDTRSRNNVESQKFGQDTLKNGSTQN